MAPFLRLGCSALALLLASPALSQDRAVTYTFYGTPGLLEMPSAISDDDGEIAATVGYFGGQVRTSFTFQITPRLSGTFRYASIEGFLADEDAAFFDRSFDLRYRLNDEGAFVPMIAVGLQDFLGTGVYAGEYVVATKTLGDSVRVTAGLGWGRFGTYNGFDNPLGVLSDRFYTRPDTFEAGETGGVPGAEAFFRGDAAVFAGVEYAPNDSFVFKAEYSSDDAYEDGQGNPLFDRASPFNFGATWRPLPGVQVGLGYLYGTQLALSGTISLNPAERPFFGGLDEAPQPVAVRADAQRALQSWDRVALPEPALRDRISAALRTEGVELASIELGDRAARLRYTNTRFRSEAQAMGRILRILTQELPASVETITLEPQRVGIPLSAVTFARSDIEAFENEVGGTAASLQQAQFEDAGSAAGLVPVPLARDPFSWSLRPYAGVSLFNASNPFNLGLGAELSAAYRIRPNVILSGSLRQSLVRFGEQEEGEFEEDYELPRVRTNGDLYFDNDHPVLSDLTLSWFGRPGRNLYSRATVGYFEPMFGGVSTELLWKPVTSRLALGLEVNYARQRDFDQLLTFRDYDVITGHASAYYDFGNGFHGQVDAGRYLAGDWGASFALDREFENGWRVGAYFTLTDVPFDVYGEGSFDKGIRFTIPVDFILGRPTQGERTTVLRSLNRDGGARLQVEGRLYDIVREGHYADLEDTWGRFWR